MGSAILREVHGHWHHFGNSGAMVPRHLEFYRVCASVALTFNKILQGEFSGGKNLSENCPLLDYGSQ